MHLFKSTKRTRIDFVRNRLKKETEEAQRRRQKDYVGLGNFSIRCSQSFFTATHHSLIIILVAQYLIYHQDDSFHIIKHLY